ncbi:MAG: phage terminase small subunit P27 family [Nitrosomonas sp.]|nr:phage terminase small subunit P27 family [Nitrosomonas sp.]
MTSRDPVTKYAKDVLKGKILAGPHVRAACQRHLDDLIKAPKRGFFFDLDLVKRVIGFFEDVLRLNGGEYEGEPFILNDWQGFIVGSLFGWVDEEGYRRFRVAYVETAKGSGKSPLAAGIGLYGLVADGEQRAEIYAAATKKDQAMVLFRDAVAMVDQSPDLYKRLVKSGVGQSVWNLAYHKTASFFRPISSDDGHSGPRVHIGLIDELHEHKTNIAEEMMRAGTKSRKQAMIFKITNSGASRYGPCWANHEYGAKVASGQFADDSFFAYICALDEGDDPFKHERCWAKANPSLKYGIPGKRYIREQVREAKGMPSKEAIVRRLSFCQWTDAQSPWISREVWMGAQGEYDWDDLKGRNAYGGLDLSSTTDLTGLVLLVEPLAQGEPWKMISMPWLPDDDLLIKEDADKVPYLRWKADGYLETTPGRAISKLAILRRLAELQNHFNIKKLGFDRWRIEDLIQLAEDEGIPLPEMVAFGQGFKDMSPALDMFESALLNGEVIHDGHPILTWCAANAVTVSDSAKNRKLSKEKSTGRIDLMVAAVMGAGIALGKESTESAKPGIFVL